LIKGKTDYEDDVDFMINFCLRKILQR